MTAAIVAAAQNPPEADFSQDNIWIAIAKAVLILVCALVSVIIAIWFERKVISRLQQRIGPNVRGPMGLFQLVYDAMKLLLKEDMNVSRADKAIYIVAPGLSVAASLMVFAVIPVGGQVTIPFTDISTPLQLTDFPVAVLYILAVTAVGVYGIVLGGWSSRATYSLLGSVRSTAQIISYELAMGLSLVTVFIMSGSMSTSAIVGAQSKLWYGVMLAPSLFLYLIAMIGETNRLPFDLPEAEGELVAGYMTEYSSMKFAWFFLAEYINMLNVSAVCTTLFLGGWRAPWPLSAIGGGVLNTGYWTILWFLAKTWLLMFVFVWVRGTVVRFRYDQFMRLGWKGLLPVALAWIVLLTTVRAIDEFTTYHFNDWAVPLLSWVVVLFIIIWYWPIKEPPPPPPPAEPEQIDPFADGFPVPPLPGQKLPPSRRELARAGVGLDPSPGGPVWLPSAEPLPADAAGEAALPDAAAGDPAGAPVAGVAGEVALPDAAAGDPPGAPGAGVAGEAALPDAAAGDPAGAPVAGVAGEVALPGAVAGDPPGAPEADVAGEAADAPAGDATDEAAQAGRPAAGKEEGQ